MLQSLRVKNLALMEETEIELLPGLNILTGETGAGKSLLIGSINLALGGKFEKEMLRKDTDTAWVELLFSGCEKAKEKLLQMELEPAEDGSILISRKMQVGRSVFRMNGESVSARQVKEVAEVLIDIHGQHEHQSLLQKKKHLEILDAFCGKEIEPCLQKITASYREVNRLQKRIEEENLDQDARSREMSLAEFEYKEIVEAKLLPREDEELEQRYQRMMNSKRIVQGLGESCRYTGTETQEGAGNAVSRALRAISGISMYDDRLQQLESQLLEVDDLLSGFYRDAEHFRNECEFEEVEFKETEDRLNTINHLKEKYGGSLEEVMAYGESRQALLEKLMDFDAYMEDLQKQLQMARRALEEDCKVLSDIRKKNAVLLGNKLQEALIHLNFLTVEFEIRMTPMEHPGEKGCDDVEFMISLNPGESLRPLSMAASGGELSRIMLAIKTVLAGKDEIDTLIFDEIDTGISGKTAWKVSEQLHQVAKVHQVICITHLPQIAAMGDAHFVIEKSNVDLRTITDVRRLDEEESLGELARLLGSDSLTEAALSNADELKSQAIAFKNER